MQRRTYDRTRALTPWVYAIARYKLIDHLRRTQESMADGPIEDANEVIERDDHTGTESRFDLRRLMAGLPEKMRQAIQYVKLDGMSITEAAARTGMSEAAIKVNVHRGLKSMARSIGRETKA